MIDTSQDGPICPFCRSPKTGETYACGTASNVVSANATLMLADVRRTGECDRRGWQNVFDAAFAAGAEIARKREEKILALLLRESM